MEKQFEYKEEYGWLTHICLNITDACPLACKYCFVEQNPHYMTLDIAKKIVYFLLENLKKKNKKFNKNKKAHITYFGGEPTLMWDEIIVPLTNWIKENDFPIDFSITTNGVLLNEERIKFLYENRIYPLLSIDGDKITQNFNRPFHNGNGSFDKIKDNIPILLYYFPELTFRATIYAPTVQYTFENYVFAIEQGFKNIFMIPDSRNIWSDEQKEILCQELDKIFVLNTELFKKGVLPLSSSLFTNAYKQCAEWCNKPKNNNRKISRSIDHCGLGISSGSIDYLGNIWGCQEQPTIEKNNNIFYLGNIKTGIETKRHSKLLVEYSKLTESGCENQNKCNNCLLKHICFGFNCPSTSKDLFNDLHCNSEINCLWIEKIFANSFIQLNTLLYKEKNELFISFLKNKGVIK